MKRFCLAALCVFLLFSSLSCEKKQEKTTEEKEPSTTVPTTTPATTNKADSAPFQEEITPVPESEILYDIEADVSTSDIGPLASADSYEVYPISTKKDLDRFRPYLSGLTAEKEATYFSKENGKLFVIEVTSTNEYSYYGISSITQAGGNLIVVISSGEDEFPTQPHTFFTLYFPPEIYQGESLQVLFE
jgi:hypothetical protein